MTVYTTRPDTLFGATFMVVAADAHAGRRAGHRRAAAGVRRLPGGGPQGLRHRPAVDRPARSPGSFLGRHAVNPANGQQIPIWAADYVLADYGTGAIMAVPGQDQRDWDFAEKFDLPHRPHRAAVRGLRGGRRQGLHRPGPGDQLRQRRDLAWTGWTSPRPRRAIIDWLEQKGAGTRAVNFRLRDWLLSRQRYWGARSRSCTARRAARCRFPRTSCPSTARAARRPT